TWSSCPESVDNENKWVGMACPHNQFVSPALVYSGIIMADCVALRFSIVRRSASETPEISEGGTVPGHLRCEPRPLFLSPSTYRTQRRFDSRAMMAPACSNP